MKVEGGLGGGEPFKFVRILDYVGIHVLPIVGPLEPSPEVIAVDNKQQQEHCQQQVTQVMHHDDTQ